MNQSSNGHASEQQLMDDLEALQDIASDFEGRFTKEVSDLIERIDTIDVDSVTDDFIEEIDNTISAIRDSLNVSEAELDALQRKRTEIEPAQQSEEE